MIPRAPQLAPPDHPRVAPKPRCTVAHSLPEGRLTQMQIHSGPIRPAPPTGPIAELDRLGDEIAELSAHLEAASARLLALIREFDARGGWNNGFRSCADWLSWRIGLDLGHGPRESPRGARPGRRCPLLAEALARGELSYAKVRALSRMATPETRRSGCWEWDAPARPRMSSRSCVAGAAWTARPRLARRNNSTRAGLCTSTRMRTARSCFGGGWSRRWVPCS